MADETIVDTNSAATEIKTAEPVGAKPKTRATPKNSLSKSKKTEADSAKSTTKVATKPVKAPKANTQTVTVTTEPAERKRKKYTPAQRASILASIEKTTKGGATTLKAALQQAEVSEQTYYNWKNAADKTTSLPSTVSSGDDLTTLVALEAENLKLRKELAEKLRAENAELRKRLGKL